MKNNNYFDIFLYLANHQMIHITPDNLIEFNVSDEYIETSYTKGSTDKLTFIKGAKLSFKPNGTYQFEDNMFNKIQILYANSDYVNYHFNPNRHIHIQVLNKSDDEITLTISEFERNDIADLNLNYHHYHQLRRHNVLKISEILKLSPRKLEDILRPKERMNQPMKVTDIIDNIRPDIYPIEQWLVRNNIPYEKSNLFNYNQHPDYILEITPLHELTLNSRATNALARSWFRSMYQLLQAEPSRIRQIRNVGYDTFNEIKNEAYRWCESNDIENIDQYPLFKGDDSNGN